MAVNNDSALKQQRDKIFEKEFYPQADSLFNFAFHLTFNETDASDLVQDTYLKAYRFIDSYEEGSNAKAWLFKVLKNSFINDYRKKSRSPHRVDYEDVIQYQDREDAAPGPALDLRQDIFQDMLGDEVATALLKLPVDYRTIILLCDVEEFTYEEMAKILDIPIGTVRSRLFRARNLLKEMLREYALSKGFKENR